MATASAFQIESGIPIPPIGRRQAAGRKHRRMPFADMRVGDSFFYATGDPTTDASRFLTNAKFNGFGITCRRVEGGLRVWRIA